MPSPQGENTGRKKKKKATVLSRISKCLDREKNVSTRRGIYKINSLNNCKEKVPWILLRDKNNERK